MQGLTGGYVCPERDPLCAIGECARPLRRAGVDVFLPRDLEIGESYFADHLLQLCFQQSASNSTGPEIDILFRLERNRPVYNYVGDLKSAAGL
jgi:hypothetical protein